VAQGGGVGGQSGERAYAFPNLTSRLMLSSVFGLQGFATNAQITQPLEQRSDALSG